MHNLEIIAPLIGGVLIGLAAGVMMLFSGRIAGISGITGGLLNFPKGDTAWRVAFVVGLLAGGVALFGIMPERFAFTVDRSLPAVAAAGLLVGFGTRLGNGCTSGHGICGISRVSRRSIVATITFIATGAISAFVVNHLMGGSL